MIALLATDVEWDARHAVPPTGLFHGHEGATEYLVKLAEHWDDIKVVPEQFHEADPALVIVSGQFHARERSSGERIETGVTHMVTFAGDKIVRLRILMDRGTALTES